MSTYSPELWAAAREQAVWGCGQDVTDATIEEVAAMLAKHWPSETADVPVPDFEPLTDKEQRVVNIYLKCKGAEEGVEKRPYNLGDCFDCFSLGKAVAGDTLTKIRRSLTPEQRQAYVDALRQVLNDDRRTEPGWIGPTTADYLDAMPEQHRRAFKIVGVL